MVRRFILAITLLLAWTTVDVRSGLPAAAFGADPATVPTADAPTGDATRDVLKEMLEEEEREFERLRKRAEKLDRGACRTPQGELAFVDGERWVNAEGLPFSSTETQELLCSVPYWYDAEKGDAEAQVKVAELLRAERPQHHRLAAQWAQKAADQNHPGGQASLALFYVFGQGVPKDMKRAADLFLVAAEQGDEGAMYNIGQMLDRGDGVPQDYAKANHWFERAAKAGNDKAYLELGINYVNGDGVAADRVEGKRLIGIAAQSKIDWIAKEAQERLQQLQAGEGGAVESSNNPPAQPDQQTSSLPLLSLEGNYAVSGTNPNGSRYGGTCRISAIDGGRYQFDWLVGNVYRGEGQLVGNTITVHWGGDAPVIYAVEADGSLVGTWASGLATETLRPQR